MLVGEPQIGHPIGFHAHDQLQPVRAIIWK